MMEMSVLTAVLWLAVAYIGAFRAYRRGYTNGFKGGRNSAAMKPDFQEPRRALFGGITKGPACNVARLVQ